MFLNGYPGQAIPDRGSAEERNRPETDRMKKNE
jgi:hypothetical protein